MARFLHTADWQLGMTRHFLGDEAQHRFTGARLDVVERIGRLAAEEGCGFVLVCGDVFESNQTSRQVLARAFEKMAAVPQVDFWLLPGNHDPLDASSIYRSPAFVDRKPENVKVLDGSEPVQAAPGVELVAAPWPNKHPTSDLVNAACEGLGPPSEGVRIVAGHGAVDAMSPRADDPKLIALERLEELVRSGQVHYVALGDRHSTTDVGGTGRVWHSGAPEPTDYNEVDPGNVLIVDVAADGVTVKPCRVGTWRFERRPCHLHGDEDIDDLEAWLEGLPDKDRTVVKLVMQGQVSVGQKARLDSLLSRSAELLAALERRDGSDGLAVTPDDADYDSLGLSGFADDALRDLADMAESGDVDQAAVARDALGLLHRLAGPAQ